MAETYIDYDAKVQNALRGVVKTVLKEAEEDGLMGDHHFYVAFKTHAEGVDIPAHLVSRFPDEMTIVVQHKFWGLKVHPDYFEIGLSFNQKPEHLTIPFAAIVGFVDPSVQFALQFHDETDSTTDDFDDAVDLENAPAGIVGEIAANIAPVGGAPVAKADSSDASTDNAATDDADTGGDNIVTLDAFRRK